jgi:hypothetical protein
MADDIAALLAGAGKTNATFGFDEIPKAYWGGLEEAYKQRMRNAFSGPDVLDASGNLDPNKVMDKALKVGGVGAAEHVKSLFETGMMAQRQQNSARAYEDIYGNPRGGQPGYSGQPPQSQSQQPAYPPSPSRTSGDQAAPDLTATPRTGPTAPAQTAGAAAPGPFAKFLEFQGVPPEQHAQATLEIQKAIMQRTGSPFKPLDMDNPAIRPVVQDVLKSFALNRSMQQQNPGAPQNAQAAAPPGAQPPPQQAQPAPPQAQPQPAPPPQPPPQQTAQAPIVPRPVQTVPVQQQRPPTDPNDPRTNPSLNGILSPQDIQRHGNWQNAYDVYQRALASPQGLNPALQADLEKKVAAIRGQLAYTEKQKEWEFEKARDPSTPPYKEWADQKAAQEGRVKIDTATAEELNKNASAIYPTLSILEDAIRLGKSAPGGMAGQAAAQLGRMMSALGMKVPETFSDAEALNAIATRLLPLVRQPGSVSNYEQQSYMQALPSLLQSKEGRIKAAEMMLKLARNGIETAKIYRDGIGRADLHEKLAAMDKPVFSKAERDELEAIAKKARGDNAGFVEVEPGVRMRTRKAD